MMLYCVLRQQSEAAGTLRTFSVVVDLSDKADYTPKIDAVLAQVLTS